MPNNGLRTAAFQFIKFNAVGLLNTLVDFAVFSLLHGLGLYYGLAQVLSYSAGTANSYILNKKITFRDSSRPPGGGADRMQLLRFVALNLIVLCISLLLLHLLTEQWGMAVLLSKLLITFITVIINFFGSRLWVFKNRGV